jgi:hypothetical protein
MSRVIALLTEKAIKKEELKYRIELMGSVIERPRVEMSSFFSSPHNEVASMNAIQLMDKENRTFRN